MARRGVQGGGPSLQHVAPGGEVQGAADTCRGFHLAFFPSPKMASKKAKGPGSMAQKVKKIMQADEDTGKLAQGAPVVLGRLKLPG